ncbi:MAG: GxxExxY protein [Verrucomicrobiota bacterium]|nr:GxxExxY protein [Verrucomicrobiota bacterium]
MENDSLTQKVIGVCFEVHNELGAGFNEKVNENALRIAFEQEGLNVRQQEPILVHFRGQVVGEYLADLIVNGSVLIELKAVKRLLPEHQSQLINYLKATDIEIGLLINFATPRFDVKRGESRNY